MLTESNKNLKCITSTPCRLYTEFASAPLYLTLLFLYASHHLAAMSGSLTVDSVPLYTQNSFACCQSYFLADGTGSQRPEEISLINGEYVVLSDHAIDNQTRGAIAKYSSTGKLLWRYVADEEASFSFMTESQDGRFADVGEGKVAEAVGGAVEYPRIWREVVESKLRRDFNVERSL